ncbi:hypothetical protein [Nitrosomonas eutropha]|uniref:hypothetical protein n=1 Tax=Nitrosomonas eutropha TaxID=916 RepID=UPI00115F8605|nr:hypothetical protein [Nitrosomonas eutropha]
MGVGTSVGVDDLTAARDETPAGEAARRRRRTRRYVILSTGEERVSGQRNFTKSTKIGRVEIFRGAQ